MWLWKKVFLKGVRDKIACFTYLLVIASLIFLRESHRWKLTIRRLGSKYRDMWCYQRNWGRVSFFRFCFEFSWDNRCVYNEDHNPHIGITISTIAFWRKAFHRLNHYVFITPRHCFTSLISFLYFCRPKDASKAIKKRLSGNKNFKSVLLTLTVRVSCNEITHDAHVYKIRIIFIFLGLWHQ